MHDHTFDGIDTALTPFPQTSEQNMAIQTDLLTALKATLCVTPDMVDPNNVDLALTLDNVAVGHGYPSGANPDRRSWVEIIAYQNGNVVYSSGNVMDGQDVTTLNDPDLWLFRDQMFDAMKHPVHMFWDAASYTGTQLPPAVTNDPGDPRYFHAVTKNYVVKGVQPDRVTVRVRILPVGYDVIDDLVASKDLDPSIKAKLPIFDLGSTVLEWELARDHLGCL